ncbi:esterase [Acidocella aquatica]|uniref:Esterase n=1 Tax=Acidocella aquatica TaxID=1922313 RepID=A0ABQ6A8T9_9PROT|nr:carboxylesterase family protein [Acidocella aquatica]GLR67012.1 esterase [Acidocella aquatica]
MLTRRSALFSAAGLLNALIWPFGYVVSHNHAYGSAPRQGLDIYTPSPSPHGGPRPVVFFIYGGSWEDGDKSIYRFVGAALAAHGFVTVIADYRIWPQVGFPVFLQDGAMALRWVVDNIARFGGDPASIQLVGHSAGAYNAAMLALDPPWLEQVGLDPRQTVRGFVGLAGPYDFLPLDTPTLKAIFGPPDQLAQTQPINFVTAAAPPMWLAAGADDTTVNPGNTLRLTARARAVGARAADKIYPGIDHRLLIGAFAAPLRPLAPVLRDTVAFLRIHAGNTASATA